jgi:Ca-activated chloride channel homolog
MTNIMASANSAEVQPRNALAHLGRYAMAIDVYQQALAQRHHWQEAQDNLELVQSLIPKAKKKHEDQVPEIPPNLPLDQVKFDEEGKSGKKAKIQQTKTLDNIQSTVAQSVGCSLRRVYLNCQFEQFHHLVLNLTATI